MPPDVSVVIPTRNRRAVLRSALHCALGQLDVDLEVIIVDDGSDIAPPRFVERSDSRVRLVRLAARGGVAQARNAGVAVARGRWISLLDDDDLWAPDKLRRQLDAAGTAGFVYTSVVVFEDDRRPVAVLRSPVSSALAHGLLQRNVMPAGSSNVMIRADTLRDLALALFVGMAVGAYSSIFVATPILVWLKERDPRLARLAERSAARGR